ncbi:hypothetical protein Tco_1075194, partial [Tanacetum coccineum]
AGEAVTTTMTITRSMHQVTKGLLVKANVNIFGLEIIKDQSGNTLRVSRSRIHNEKLLEARSIRFFVDFDYVMGRSITVMSRSITGYWLMILGCAGSLKANLQHIEALSTTKVGYMTFTEAWKKEIWLKGLLTELGYELRLVAAIGALVKGGSRSEVPTQVKVAAYRYSLIVILRWKLLDIVFTLVNGLGGLM